MKSTVQPIAGRMVLAFAMAVALSVLGGCSSNREREKAVGLLRNLLVNPFVSAPGEEIRPPADKPFVVVSYEGIRSPMTLQQSERGFEHYTGPGGVEMSLQAGILSRLRGVGQEYEALYIAPDSPLHDLEKAAAQNTELGRIMEYWENRRPKRNRFLCSLSRKPLRRGLRRVLERCQSVYDAVEFENLYWFRRDGKLLRSRQWFHPKASSLYIQHHDAPGFYEE